MTTYSAVVRIQLRVGDLVLKVAQLGPKFLILRQPVNHPPVIGEITMSIDGDVKCWRVHLDEGIRTDRLKTPIRPCLDA